MNYKQKERIAQVSEKTLVIGVDIGSEKHYARAFDYRGIEKSKKAFGFTNDVKGFDSFKSWAEAYEKECGCDKIIVGMEPTGHYWFNLWHYAETQKMKVVTVAPQHVKHSK